MIIATVGFQQFTVESPDDAITLMNVFKRCRAVADVHPKQQHKALFLTGESLLKIETTRPADLLSQDASTEIIRKRFERAEREFNKITRTQ